MMDENDDSRKASKNSRRILRVVAGIHSGMSRPPRNRIEQREQQQAGGEAADMRLPGDAGTVGADRNRTDAEDDVDAEPDRKEADDAAIAQRLQQRQRRNL